MSIITTKVNAGATAPFRILHISDTHLCLCDERNDERKQKLAEGRAKCFPNAEAHLETAEALAKAENLPIAHTGDLIDFVSEANLDRSGKFIRDNNVLFAAGNHEFSLYVGEAFEDEAYREQSLSHVQEYFKDDIRFNCRIINGVNLIAIDNGYYRFDVPQLEALKREAERGLPIILFMHNPLFEKSLFEFSRPNGDAAYLVSTPVELMSDYSEYRFKQQKADELTEQATAFIESCPLVKAIFTGHLHRNFESIVADKIPQYVTGIGTERMICVE